jgi:hypothetical protein
MSPPCHHYCKHVTHATVSSKAWPHDLLQEAWCGGSAPLSSWSWGGEMCWSCQCRPLVDFDLSSWGAPPWLRPRSVGETWMNIAGGKSMAKVCESIVGGALEFLAILWVCSSTTSTNILALQKPMARSHGLVHLLHLDRSSILFSFFLFWDIHWGRDLYSCHMFPFIW